MQTLFAQTSKSKTDFYFHYSISGLGSGVGILMPTIKIHKTKLVYTKEQNSYYGKRSKNPEFICSASIRQSSIDSILLLISGLEDSMIYKTNPCIMSGSVTYVTIAYGKDTTKFTLHNTSDYIVIKIVDIINTYLPEDKKLYESIENIKSEVECWTSLRENADKQKADSIKVKQ